MITTISLVNIRQYFLQPVILSLIRTMGSQEQEWFFAVHLHLLKALAPY